MSDISTINEEAQRRYWTIFQSLEPIEGVVSGERAASVFKASNLGNSTLERIWDLADIDADGLLDFEEFCIAMHLIYEILNGTVSAPPSRLPDHLIPTSKADLVSTGNDSNEYLNNRIGPDTRDSEREFHQKDRRNDDASAAEELDWYISPSNNKKYEAIYTSCKDSRGGVSYDALGAVFDEIDVPPSQIRTAWFLINPKDESTIGKDQTIYFMYILESRSRGTKIPDELPRSLRNLFNKRSIDYNVSSLDTTNRSSIDSHSDRGRGASPHGKSDFASSYLERIGYNRKTQSNKPFSGTFQRDGRAKDGSNDNVDDENKLEKELERIQHEIEGFEARRRELDEKRSDSTRGVSGGASQVRSDIIDLRSQIDSLRNHLKKREEVLESLSAE